MLEVPHVVERKSLQTFLGLLITPFTLYQRRSRSGDKKLCNQKTVCKVWCLTVSGATI